MAKLTRGQRSKMSKSTFCGPDRSYPVPDLKHAAVAKSYLHKSKLPESTKSKILACINRKQEQLKKGK